jgi:TRAP-type C4-dicarboxylate transport system substrate-binding protein
VLALLVGALSTGCSGSTDSSGEAKTGEAKTQPQKVYKWKMVTHQMPGTSRYEETVVPFCKMIEEASGGRLIIEPYGAGVLFPVTDTLDAVKNGVVEMAAIWSGYWAGRDPVFGLAGSIPGDVIKLFDEHYYRSEKLDALQAKAYDKQGVKYLGGFDFGPSEILMSRVPIRTLDDFKGKKIRTAGISAEFYKELGMSPVSLSAPEIYQALQLGTVDAAEYNDWLVNSEMGLHEVTKYVIEPVLHQGAVDDKVLLVNPAAWAELPDDLKKIVLVARDAVRYRSAIAYSTGGKLAKIEKWKNIEIIQLPEDDVRKAQEIAANFLVQYSKKSQDAAEFLKTYAEALYELGYVDRAKALGYTK